MEHIDQDAYEEELVYRHSASLTQIRNSVHENRTPFGQIKTEKSLRSCQKQTNHKLSAILSPEGKLTFSLMKLV